MKRKHIFIGIVLSLALIILGSFIDLKASQSLCIGYQVGLLFVTAIGQYPLFGGFALLGGIIFATYKKSISNKVLQICFLIGSFVLVAVGGLLQGKSLVDYDAFGFLFPAINKIYFAAPIGILLVVPMFVVGYKKGKINNDSKRLFYSTVIAMCAIVLMVAVSFVIKKVIDRPRFIYLNNYQHLEYYSNWWENFDKTEYFMGIDNVTKDMFSSFPSGHALGASASMIILPLFVVKENKNKGFYIGLIFTLLVSLSRVLQGDHYISDVSFGMLIGLVFTYIANEVIIKKDLSDVSLVQKEE